MKRSLCLLAISALFVLSNGHCARAAAPKPATVPTDWELDFEHSQPRRIVVALPGEKDPRAFWYMIFKVANPSQEERVASLALDMMNEDGSLVPVNKGVPSEVFNAIQQQTKNKLMEPLSNLVKNPRLLAGEDQARTSVAIWPEFSPRMKKFSIFVGGLSGEAKAMNKGADGNLAEITDMVALAMAMAKDPEAQKSVIVFWKTLRMDFEVWGDQYLNHANDPVKQVGPEEWIMR